METNDPPERTMQIQRASMSHVVEPTAASLRSAAPPPQQVVASQKSVTTAPTERAPTEEVPKHHATKAPAMPDMSSSDRAAIATSTGFYISPTGEVTPDGMPPWSFIMAALEKRHAQGASEPGAEATAEGAAGPKAASGGEGVDVLA
jgi:hypothetical protein